MIQSFKDSFTELVFFSEEQEPLADITARGANKAFIWLHLLHDAKHPEDLNLAPEHPLHLLAPGSWMLRMPKGWKITFTWLGHDACDVSLQPDP